LSDQAFDPGHVVTREHYERLAREAAVQEQQQITPPSTTSNSK
jgi:hypothetical protein